MASVFTKIIEGEFPARFIYKDDVVVSFLTINPVTPGHVLVVPIAQVDHWIDLDEKTLSHIMKVSKKISKVLMDCFECERIGFEIAGFEVPHTHIHLIPANHNEDMDLSLGDPTPSPEFLDAIQTKIVAHLENAL